MIKQVLKMFLSSVTPADGAAAADGYDRTADPRVVYKAPLLQETSSFRFPHQCARRDFTFVAFYSRKINSINKVGSFDRHQAARSTVTVLTSPVSAGF